MPILDLAAIGARLREIRGGLSQTAFAARLGLERQSVRRYESGERAPDAEALVRLQQEFGVDPGWVLTGGGRHPVMTEEERRVLALFRNGSVPARAAALAALASSPSGVAQTFHGDVGQMIHGSVNQSDLVFNIGGNRGGRRKK